MWMLGVAAFVVGCASRGQLDVLESRLRQQEDSISQLQTQLSTSQSQLQAARRETADLNTQLTSGTRTARIEQLSALGQVEAIELNKFLTGGLDRDGSPGDELFSAVIVPTDSQGNLVKVPGSVSLTLFDLSLPEAQQRIGRWEFTPKQCESLWHSGFLGSGYIVRVPWQQPPQSAALLVHARLKTIDGRQFDTSQSIHIVPPTGAPPRPSNVVASTKERAASGPASLQPLRDAANEPAAKKEPATDAAWWDESKQPATSAADPAQPSKELPSSKPE
jgi:outer membrane murein-binding lipoprotein Lpp